MFFQSIGKRPSRLFFVAVSWSVLLFFSLLRCKSPESDQPPLCDYSILRVGGFEFIKPPLALEPACESRALLPLKRELVALADSLKNAAAIRQASVYFREFDHGEWFSINDAERYHPASLMKISLMLSVLQIADATPGLLEEKLVYKRPESVVITPQYYNFPTIELGKSYSVHELLYYMIANSDNHATWLLASRVDTTRTKKLFFDLGLEEPVQDELQFTMTARECSVFFKSIYNSSLLSPEYADYAARLLSHCAFQEGFGKGFLGQTKMWHKFGEWSYAGHDNELHEAGVVYWQGKPYLIVIMTRGADRDKLAGAISLLSGAISKRLPAPAL